MQRGQVDMCIVGTDRTLSNGDVCNKIGTYLKALSAKDNDIPFYVALPSSTIDWSIKDHKQIPIEERNSEELSHIEGVDENNEIRKVRIECMATVGTVGNSEHLNIKKGKAGRNRWLGRRPTVRGVVMNPIDHPHGGGEGKTSGGRHPVTPWGKPTKGAKTRKRKDTDKYILKRK